MRAPTGDPSLFVYLAGTYLSSSTNEDFSSSSYLPWILKPFLIKFGSPHWGFTSSCSFQYSSFLDGTSWRTGSATSVIPNSVAECLNLWAPAAVKYTGFWFSRETSSAESPPTEAFAFEVAANRDSFLAFFIEEELAQNSKGRVDLLLYFSAAVEESCGDFW